MVGGVQKGALAAYGNYLTQFGPINMQKKKKKQHINETKASAPFQLGTNKCASKNEGVSICSQQAVVCFTVVPGFTQGGFLTFIP